MRPYSLNSIAALLAFLTMMSAVLPVHGQDAPVAPTAETKPPAPKNRTGKRSLESTITAVDNAPNIVKITLRDGVLTLGLKPTTELVQEERGLAAADLNDGDTLSLVEFKSKGKLKGRFTVESKNPLVVKFEDLATLTITKVEAVQFDRYTPLKPAALAVGQTVAIEMNVLRDGEIEAKRVAVVIVKPKTKKPAKPKTPKQ